MRQGRAKERDNGEKSARSAEIAPVLNAAVTADRRKAHLHLFHMRSVEALQAGKKQLAEFSDGMSIKLLVGHSLSPKSNAMRCRRRLFSSGIPLEHDLVWKTVFHPEIKLEGGLFLDHAVAVMYFASHAI
jgi:hypothetical protein